jgi:hypothetical protein
MARIIIKNHKMTSEKNNNENILKESFEISTDENNDANDNKTLNNIFEEEFYEKINFCE